MEKFRDYLQGFGKHMDKYEAWLDVTGEVTHKTLVLIFIGGVLTAWAIKGLFS